MSNNIIKRVGGKLYRLLNFESTLGRYSERLANEMTQRMSYVSRKEFLIQQASTSSISGVTSDRYCDYEVIVSMATHGERFFEAYIAIESIMQQTIKPNRIILNVAENEHRDTPVPPFLHLQQKRGLEINYCEDYWSYKKIVPTLRRYPDAVIITVDDDCLYNADMIENMLLAYKNDPKAIWGNRIHDITFDENHKIMSYMDWNWRIANTEETSILHFITTVGGVLYPPHSLYKDVTRDDIFMSICKTNDDIWCYVMAMLAGTSIKKVHTHSPFGEEYILEDNIQESGLANYNTAEGKHFCQNDNIFKRVLDYYGLNVWDEHNKNN